MKVIPKNIGSEIRKNDWMVEAASRHTAIGVGHVKKVRPSTTRILKGDRLSVVLFSRA
jgi:hypothetical protein